MFFRKEMKFEQLMFATLLAPLLADDYVLGPKVTTEYYPFIARLGIYGKGSCTGSLVANDLILTATHCFYDEQNNKLYPDGEATFNDANADVREGGEVTYKMRFVKNYAANDLTLAKLEKKVTGIKPVKISIKPLKRGDSVKAVGFGMHGWSGSTNPDWHLRHVDLKVSWVTQNWIYTSVGPNMEGPCAGDSGGPLLVWNRNEWSVVAALFGGGYDCRSGNVDGDDLWSSLKVMGSDDLKRWG